MNNGTTGVNSNGILESIGLDSLTNGTATTNNTNVGGNNILNLVNLLDDDENDEIPVLG